jgi:hypothetical protein
VADNCEIADVRGGLRHHAFNDVPYPDFPQLLRFRQKKRFQALQGRLLTF